MIMESFNFPNPNFQVVSPVQNWDLGDTINRPETPAFGTDGRSTVQMHQLVDDNDFTLTQEHSLVVAPREQGIEPDVPKRISRGDWEKHRELIKTQYSFKTLTELRQFMMAEHGFIASTQQWKKKLAEWHLSKNLRPHVTKFIRKRAHRRLVNVGKATQFSLGGQSIPMDKVKRHLQDPPNDPPSPTGSTPTDLSYCTYKSPIMVPTRLNPPSNLFQASTQEEYSHSTSSTPRSDMVEIGPLIPALWKGHDVDYFLTVARDASSFATSGDYRKAKTAFIEALEGLGVLLSPVHAQTVSVLENFVREAGRNDDLPAALEKLHTSYNAHKDLLGVQNKRTWRSLARLGSAYLEEGNINQAYHMLLNARQGLFANATELGPEVAFVSTRQLTDQIIFILRRQGDFEAAEEEYIRLISLLESLGEAHLLGLAFYKQGLANLYLFEMERQHARNNTLLTISAQQIENLIQDALQVDSANKNKVGYIQCLDYLCVLYFNTRQGAKLLQSTRALGKEIEDTICLGLFSNETVLNAMATVVACYFHLRGPYKVTVQLDKVTVYPHILNLT
ncbi:hypothetical protein K449DRAFT_470508 [Hypoxylon sp. EC38]|nr:hypothetical protein K449DRAFT_470508 [Hypoxylon sp. EC38]